jgi:hypothetical protein
VLVFFRLYFLQLTFPSLLSSHLFSAGLSRTLKNFEPNLLNRMAVAVQMSHQGWQHLSQFGCGCVRADQ